MRRPFHVPIALVSILTILASTTAAPADDEQVVIEKEMQALRGTWMVEKQLRNGREEEAEGLTITLTTHGQFSISDKDGVLGTGFFLIDPTQKVKSIDYWHTQGKWKGQWQRGVYKLNGETLTLCWPEWFGGDRPLRLTAETGSNNVLAIYKRQPKGP